jgi:hypothetical protein
MQRAEDQDAPLRSPFHGGSKEGPKGGCSRAWSGKLDDDSIDNKRGLEGSNDILSPKIQRVNYGSRLRHPNGRRNQMKLVDRMIGLEATPFR